MLYISSVHSSVVLIGIFTITVKFCLNESQVVLSTKFIDVRNRFGSLLLILRYCVTYHDLVQSCNAYNLWSLF